jgi:hypothetical protein
MAQKSVPTRWRIALAALAVWAAALAYAQDNAVTLARILAEKGTISAAELARIEGAAPGDRVNALAALLQQKGVLTSSEVARLNPPAAAVSGQQLAAAHPSGPTTSPQTAEQAPPVVAQSKFPVTVYGTLVLNAFDNTALGNITDIPLFLSKQGSDASGNDKTFGMTARQSRFGLRYEDDHEIAGGKLSGQFEFDLLGGSAPFGNGANMDLFRLRLAYGKMDWTHVSVEAGQDWSIFAPLNPTSFAEYAIPSMSASGNPWIRMPQLRVDLHGALSDQFKLLAQFAAIDPNVGDYSTTAISATAPPGIGERGRAPGVETRFALTDHVDDRDFTVGVSGHYTHGKNSGPVGTVTEQIPIDSWGVALDYTLPFTRRFNLSGELYTGRGLGIFSVTSGESILPPGSLGDKGVRSSGGWIQAQYNFTRKWQMNLVYGIDDPRARDLPVGDRMRNQSYMGNIMYKYTPHATIAWEYRRLLTDYRNQIFANERGDHVDLALVYVF